MKRNRKGFTLVEIMIVVAIIGILAAIAIPNFIKSREASQKNACIANLKQLEGAIAQYKLDNNNAQPGMGDLWGANNYIRGDAAPACPAGGTYDVSGDVPSCSINDHELP